jgi:hypothetical protein
LTPAAPSTENTVMDWTLADLDGNAWVVQQITARA